MMRNIHGNPHVTRIAILAGLLTLSGGLLQAQKSAPKSTVPAKADARMVAHVLDRIGFGARPGDVARIQQIGLAAYIDQQLHPERIADGALNARLSEFPTISLKTSELAEEYFNPADEARRLQQQQQARAQAMDPTMSGGAAGAPPPPPNPNQPQPPPSPEQRMLQQKAQSVPNELMQAKLLRAAMSERQLEE